MTYDKQKMTLPFGRFTLDMECDGDRLHILAFRNDDEMPHVLHVDGSPDSVQQATLIAKHGTLDEAARHGEYCGQRPHGESR